MGFDLRAVKKGGGEFSFGAFSWPWMLGLGVGLPIGYGDGFKPATFVYTPDKKGLSPGYNDGFRVTARQAKQMAACAAGLAKVLRFRQKEWDALPEQERNQIEKSGADYYKKPVRSDWVEKVEKFAEWAEKSGGFRIW